jgi:RNA polymerase sigma-70 factor (ECF subfamily)
LDAAPRTTRRLSGLYRQHQRAVYRFCFARLGNEQEAEDAASDTWMKVLMHFDEDRPEEFVAFLFTVARRQVIDVQRRLVRRPAVSLDAPGQAEPAGEEDAATVVRRVALVEGIARLTDDQQEVIYLKLADMTNGEIAKTLNIEESAVKMRTYRAMKALRLLLNDEGSAMLNQEGTDDN